MENGCPPKDKKMWCTFIADIPVKTRNNTLIFIIKITIFGGTITQKSSKMPFAAESFDFGKTENPLENRRL